MLDFINQIISAIVSNSYLRVVFAITTGLLLSLTLASFGWGFYAWFGLIPLIILIKSAQSFREMIWISTIFLFSYNLISFIWLLGLHPLTWQGFSGIESVTISLFGCLIPTVFHSLILIPFVIATKLFFVYRADERTYELKILDTLIIAFVWVAIEHKLLLGLGHDWGAFAVPVNLLVYSQYQNLPLIQITNLIGAVGLEFIMVCVNLFLSNLFNVQIIGSREKLFTSKFNVRKRFFGVEKVFSYISLSVLCSLVFLFIYIYGLVNLSAYKKLLTSLHPIQTAILQADYSAEHTRGKVGLDKLLALQLELSSKLSKKTDLLIWSEGALPYDQKEELIQSNLELIRTLTNIFIFGTFTSEEDKVYNSLQLLQLTDESSAEIYKSTIYHKHLLVPFGEYTPFYQLLPNKLKNLADHSVGNGFSVSEKISDTVYTTVVRREDNKKYVTHLKIAPTICFELLFPQLVRAHVLEGSQVIININDLSWFASPLSLFGNRNEKFLNDFVNKIFLAIAVFRATENQRDLVLAGNSGPSAFITATGEIKSQTKVHEIKLLENQFIPLKANSLYTEYGW